MTTIMPMVTKVVNDARGAARRRFRRDHLQSIGRLSVDTIADPALALPSVQLASRIFT